MSEWKTYRLGDICQVLNGRAYKQEELLNQGPYPVLRVGNILQGNNWYYSDLELPDDKYCYNGDLLYAWSCGFAPYIWKGKKSIYHYHIWKLKENTQIIDKLFFYYYLIIHTKYNLGGTHGSVMLHLTKKDFENQTLHLPPLDEQRRIAGILGSLDDKIELNRRLNANLEAQAQALFRSWFVDFEPFRDGPFVDSQLGKIPQGWKVGTLSEIGDVIGGGTPSKIVSEYYTDNGIAWITPKDLSTNNCKFTSKGETDISELGYKNSSAKLMPRGSVLFSSRAPIGYISIAKNEICTNQGFKSIVPKKAGTCFIYYFLRNNTSKIESMASGSTFKEASGGLMKSLEVIIPSNKILTAFEEAIQPLFNMQEHNEDENARLSALRDTLLPKLMAGEINLH